MCCCGNALLRKPAAAGPQSRNYAIETTCSCGIGLLRKSAATETNYHGNALMRNYAAVKLCWYGNLIPWKFVTAEIRCRENGLLRTCVASKLGCIFSLHETTMPLTIRTSKIKIDLSFIKPMTHILWDGSTIINSGQSAIPTNKTTPQHVWYDETKQHTYKYTGDLRLWLLGIDVLNN